MVGRESSPERSICVVLVRNVLIKVVIARCCEGQTIKVRKYI